MNDLFASSRFPAIRMRRNRQKPWLRSLVAEQSLSVSDLILPIFVIEGENEKRPIDSMPGVQRWSIDLVPEIANSASELGIPLVALFPYIEKKRKTPTAEEALNPENLVCRALRSIREAGINIGTLCDVALDPYSSHGHDGIVQDGKILNDESIDILCEQAIVQAAAGCDIVAPSDMLDGRVGKIRKALDSNGFEDTPIMAYAAKYASNFYGPFRDAIGTLETLTGDKKTYQMNPANSDEALREVALDIGEGADMVIIKPGLPYLDIIYRTKEAFCIPTFVYNVSGEYAMIKAAASSGSLDYEKAIMEILIGFKRAGADGILTYSALDAARILKG
ncbi:MAG: Delta-aminolevulinic acid dehydratase [Alphaproteobacteria bacterium MarineAlpha3_Bin5]|nr:MAG: Delta-aminolevulinic acid dehydratase [Alphaproteobacteria bacterium MarineAlpha3_Bin5]